MLKRALLLSTSLLLVAALFFSLPGNAKGESANGDAVQFQKIQYVLFHLESCPHCRDEIIFLNEKITPKYGEYIDFKLYEVSIPANQKIFQQYGVFYSARVGSVPIAFIDGQTVIGYGTDDTTGKQITGIIEGILADKGVLLADDADGDSATLGKIALPILGTIDPGTISLPLLTLTLGLLDGFNPCAMWVLLFLITLLLGMNDKKRMWLFGSIFILTSGIVYFIFMAAWLQFIMFLGLVAVIRWLIGLVAIYVGGTTVRKFWKNRKAEGVICDVTGSQKNQRFFDKIKQVIHRKHLLWSVAGIIILGFSINLVELACSAGFPAVFTQVLAMADIAMWERYSYMAAYIFFYMLDDMIVFAIAMITLQAKGLGGKYAKYVNAFSGLLILILGLLLIFKPEWLMFT